MATPMSIDSNPGSISSSPSPPSSGLEDENTSHQLTDESVSDVSPAPVQLPAELKSTPFAPNLIVQGWRSDPEPASESGIDQEILSPAGSAVLFRSIESARIRTQHACEKCRIRKAKCSGEHPTCKRCRDRGLTCEYSQEPRVRGPSKPRLAISTNGQSRKSKSPLSATSSPASAMLPPSAPGSRSSAHTNPMLKVPSQGPSNLSPMHMPISVASTFVRYRGEALSALPNGRKGSWAPSAVEFTSTSRQRRWSDQLTPSAIPKEFSEISPFFNAPHVHQQGLHPAAFNTVLGHSHAHLETPQAERPHLFPLDLSYSAVTTQSLGVQLRQYDEADQGQFRWSPPDSEPSSATSSRFPSDVSRPPSRDSLLSTPLELPNDTALAQSLASYSLSESHSHSGDSAAEQNDHWSLKYPENAEALHNIGVAQPSPTSPAGFDPIWLHEPRSTLLLSNWGTYQ